MKKGVRILFLILGLSAIIAGAARPVCAGLGESSGSIESDRNVLSASRHTMTALSGYTVEEITSDSVAVREYIAPSGVVFGIAWNGLVHPDLAPLLGSYAEEYQQALEQTPRKPGRRRLQVKTPRVVVEKWGHMRNLRGRAYAPALIPPGVSIDEIK